MSYCQNLINDFLQQIAGNFLNHPSKLFVATKYSLLNNGKRVRSALVYAVADLFDIELTKLNAAAASIELIHCYSLVHDDLPAMDDDDLRRGNPSCHKAFDEATAILVGDALQALAFQILSDQKFNPWEASVRSDMVLQLAKASGFSGMVCGQARDIESENKTISLKDLESIHIYKTGALINSCIELALLANSGNDGDNQLIKQQLLVYGHHLGLIFQIKDDILDVEQSTETLGKTSKSDQKSQKATFVSLLGLNGAKQQLDEHYNLAILALQNLSGYNNKKIKLLQRFADYFITRNF